MPFTFERQEKTLRACPKCGSRPIKKDHIDAKGKRLITYFCPSHPSTMTAGGKEEEEARRAWIRLVLNARKWG